MGTRNRIKGPALVSATAAALAALVLLGAAAALVAPGAAGASASRAGGSLCPPGKQFWDAAEERCRDCSVCREPRHFVLRACHVLADTKCGYARELAMGRVRPRHHHSAAAAAPTTTTPAPVSTGVVSAVSAERGVHRPRGRWSTEMEGGGGGAGSESGERAGHWPAALVRRMHKHRDRTNNSSSSTGHNHHLKKYRDYLFHHHHHHRQKARPPESAAQLLGAEGLRGTAETSGPSGGGGGAAAPTSVAATASAAAVATGAAAAGVAAVATSAGAGIAGQPLSTAEELAWDWQAAVLVAAVAACALFFGAAALHGFRQLRQDARRSADADNLSATLSLMVPELINDIPYSCSADGHNINQCLYIEQLLVRKNEESKEGQGNVYIDRGKGKMCE